MIYKETVEIFNKYKDVFISKCNEYGCANLLNTNGSNIFLFPEVPDCVINQVIKTFNLSVDECILYVFDISLENRFDKGMVITDCGISFILDEENDVNWLFWSDIKYVEFKNDVLFFYGYDVDLDILAIDFSLFIKDRFSLPIMGTLFCQIFNEIAKKNISDISAFETNGNEEVNISENILEQECSLNNENPRVRKYLKYEIEIFKEESITKIRNLLILWSAIAFICLLIGGFMVVIPIIFVVPIIILLCSYLSLINKDDDYWEREYSKLWKNLSDIDKLKTIGRIAGGIFKIFG